VLQLRHVHVGEFEWDVRLPHRVDQLVEGAAELVLAFIGLVLRIHTREESLPDHLIPLTYPHQSLED
jgi:hypothetical protein